MQHTHKLLLTALLLFILTTTAYANEPDNAAVAGNMVIPTVPIHSQNGENVAPPFHELVRADPKEEKDDKNVDAPPRADSQEEKDDGNVVAPSPADVEEVKNDEHVVAPSPPGDAEEEKDEIADAKVKVVGEEDGKRVSETTLYFWPFVIVFCFLLVGLFFVVHRLFPRMSSYSGVLYSKGKIESHFQEPYGGHVSVKVD